MITVKSAEQKVIRAALSCLTPSGWIYGSGGLVAKQAAVMKLESALHQYKKILKASKKPSRTSTTTGAK